MHHITPRFEYWDSDTLDWANVNDLSNLITLCPTCHGPLEGEFCDADPDEFTEQGATELGDD